MPFKATIIPKDAMPTKVEHTKVMSILEPEELTCRRRNTWNTGGMIITYFDHKEMTAPLVVLLFLRMHVRQLQTGLDSEKVDTITTFKATIIPKDAMPTKVEHTKIMSILELEELSSR